MSKASVIMTPKKSTIMLGGIERPVSYDLNAFILLEDEYGNITEALKNMQEGNVKALRAIIWAGLQDETLKPADVGAMVSMASLESTIKQITLILNDNLSDQQAPLQDGAPSTMDPK